MCLYCSFPVAIKCSRLSKESNANELLEEAKSMLETNAFHENIVNLQGLTYKKAHLLNTKIEVLITPTNKSKHQMK